MKRISFVLSICIIIIVFGTSAVKSVQSSGAAPVGYTGATTGTTCIGCHPGNPLNATGGSVTTAGLPTTTAGYTLGKAYSFSLTITHNASDRKRWGFAVKAINASGAAVGTFSTTNINASIASGEIRHSNAPTTTVINTYTFNNLTWTAPATNILADKTIRFFIAGNAANGSGSSGDFIYTTSLSVPKAITTTITSFTPIIASAGTVVTIKGNGFTGATDVSFGGIAAASNSIVNDTTINATVGIGASGNISVTSPIGTGTFAGFTFCPTATTQTLNLSGCNSYVYNGTTYTTSTIKKDTLKTSKGCDSVYKTANITIKKINPNTQTLNFSGCNSYVYNGTTYTTSTIKKDTLRTTQGNCDSVYKTANITIKTITPTTQNLNFSGCNSYVYNGTTYTISTIKKDTLRTTQGNCDSVYKTANIAIKTITPTTQNLNFSGCNSYVYNGTTYTTSTIKKDTLRTTQGNCDSVYKTANITIKTITPTTQNLNFSGCNSYVYNGTTYTTSTIKKDTLRTTQGSCDSVYKTANITVTQNVTPTNNITSNSSNICYNEKVTFMSTANNGGTSATYQWLKNGNIINGNTTTTYVDSILNNADSVWSILTSSLTCVTSQTAKSNVIKTTVKSFVKGNIKNPNGIALKNVKIKRTGSIVDSVTTTNNYSFVCIAPGSNGIIKPFKNNDVQKNNGVSAFDIILTQNHILGKTKLNSPYKIIAADVNNNKTVTNIDLVFMKRLILGLDTSFTGNRLWAFIDSAYQFADTTNPFPYKDSISFTNLTSNKPNQTFIGVKLGDVNYDWNANVARGVAKKPVELICELSTSYRVQNPIRVPVKVNNFKDLVAMQYTLNFNNKDYEFVNLESFKNLQGFEFNTSQANKTGNISFLWADAKGEEKTLADGSLIFELVLKPKQIAITKDLKLILTNEITEIEVWDKDFNQHNIVLSQRITNNEQGVLNNEIWTVSPNPTSGNIVANMVSNKNKVVVFELSNAQGKTLYTQSVEAVRGNNILNINLKKKSSLQSGLYFLKANGITQRLIIN